MGDSPGQVATMDHVDTQGLCIAITIPALHWMQASGEVASLLFLSHPATTNPTRHMVGFGQQARHQVRLNKGLLSALPLTDI